MDIKVALHHLDPANDDHWTGDGMPRMDVVSEFAGRTLTRAEVTNAAPDFTRHTATEATEESKENTADAQPPAESEAEGEGNKPDETEAKAEAEGQVAPEPEPEQGAEDAAGDAPMNNTPVLSPLEQLEAELADETQRMHSAQRVVESAKSEAEECSNRVNTLNRRIEAIRKEDPNFDTASVRAYIKQQTANRMEKAMARQRFVQMSGLSPNDIAEAIDSRAPLDKAFAGRKPPRGSQRPPVRQ